MTKISVIMPLFNAEAHLTETLESYRTNAFPGVELIVVDDGSTDRSVEILQSAVPDCILLQQENQGPASARNRGLRECSGRFVAFLDSDDLWPDGTLQLLLDTLASSPDARIAQGKVETFADGEIAEAMKTRLNPEPFYGVSLASALYYRQDLLSLQGFDERLRFGEDTDLWIRFWEEGFVKQLLPNITHRYRLHQTNMTIRSASDPRTLLPIMKRHRDRMASQTSKRQSPIPLTQYLGWESPR